MQSPDHAKTVAMLAVVNASLGQSAEAISQADRAVELLPIGKDSFDGPLIATTRAAVLAEAGERDHAIEELQSLVNTPNGPTAGTLKIEPQWDNLRGDSRFQKLMSAT